MSDLFQNSDAGVSIDDITSVVNQYFTVREPTMDYEQTVDFEHLTFDEKLIAGFFVCEVSQEHDNNEPYNVSLDALSTATGMEVPEMYPTIRRLEKENILVRRSKSTYSINPLYREEKLEQLTT